MPARTASFVYENSTRNVLSCSWLKHGAAFAIIKLQADGGKGRAAKQPQIHFKSSRSRVEALMAQLFIQQFSSSYSANNKTEKLYCRQLKIQDEQQVCNKKAYRRVCLRRFPLLRSASVEGSSHGWEEMFSFYIGRNKSLSESKQQFMRESRR